MDKKEVSKKLEELVSQCNAYLVVLPKMNTGALAIVDQLKSQISSILENLNFDNDRNSENPLSPRERQVLTLLSEGHPNKEIAYQLSISPKTVQFHIKSLFIKLEVSSRTEAVTVALKKGFLVL